MTLQKHILSRVGMFTIVMLLLMLLFYIKFLFTKDGVEIFQFALFGFIWLFMSASYLLFAASDLRENVNNKNKRKFNLITGYSLFAVLILLTLYIIRGATYLF